MPDRGAPHPQDALAAELLADLPNICAPVCAAEDAWKFVATLTQRLAAVVPHAGLALLWLAEDHRSFRVLADTQRGALREAGERSERGQVAVSPLRAALAGEGLSIFDARAEPSFRAAGEFERARLSQGARAWAAVPLARGGVTRGALVVLHGDPGAFTATHMQHLAAVAGAIVPFVEASLLLAQMGERERRRRALREMDAALAASLDLRKIFDGIAAAVRPIFGFDVMGVELVRGGRTSERLVEYGGSGAEVGIRNVDEFSPNAELLAGRAVLVHDARSELDPARRGDRALLDAGVLSCALAPLVFPLSASERAQGVVYLWKRRPYWFDALDLETLNGLAGPVTLAIHHHRRVEQGKRSIAASERVPPAPPRGAPAKDRPSVGHAFEAILGNAPALREVLQRAGKVAPTETTALITGESGTGKELVAHAMHLGSPRAAGPYTAINCAALPEALLESELFGHEKGAFTGALVRKPGRFELTAGGTLFLDEVGELALPVQAKLLRVLQEREYQPVGGTRTLRADVRLLAATNRDLAAEVARGRFREDLLYRLNVFQLHLPPLRERGDDVLLLAEHFVRELSASTGKRVAGLSMQARELLRAYPWPGNIRELQNSIQRAIILCEGDRIEAAHLGLDLARVAASPGSAPESAGVTLVDQSLPEAERRLVIEALRKAGGNKSRAAEILGITRSQLYTRMKRAGL